ncbi:UDP-3-O-acyl-N-acetylglucosamine deacetylase [Anaerosinus massiliensis]|uniref:UDP-3-O-acyl-N-acetylglucosamine deacetylase n=1 Tax=Massilibacillus massiliensis TaxID=1806837 RepID=UPI000AD2E7B1|nr:UDP-3-O-acyl-N-acetylglucosamine deacetylase [Massilibacillus massiliensis]
MQYQTTIAKEVTYTGIGLHSGCQVTMKLKPAPVNTGIVFIRIDIEGSPMVAAISDNVTATIRATTIESGKAKVFTIEHLMSAFHALGLDNCYVEIDAVEPPVTDGSALVFFELIQSAGIVKQAEESREVIIDRTYIVRKDDKFAMILPYDGFRVSFTSVNPSKLIGVEYADYEITAKTFYKEIAPARTIAYQKEIEDLQKMGLGLGGTLENVIVYDDEKWLTKLRFEDELVRHKVLDIIGDLRLVGRIRGHIVAVKSSHAINTELAKQISTAICK